MSLKKAEDKTQTLLLTPPFYWEFQIYPLIY